MTAQPDMTRHELSQAILKDDLTKFANPALWALEELAYVDMQQLPTADATAAWQKVNAEIARRERSVCREHRMVGCPCERPIAEND